MSGNARRDVAVLALIRARQRHDNIRAIVMRRVGYDLDARRIAMVLSAIEPLLIAVEHLLPEPGG